MERVASESVALRGVGLRVGAVQVHRGSLARVVVHGHVLRGTQNAARADAVLVRVRHVPHDGREAEPAVLLLAVKYLSVFSLLLHLKLPHLVVLLSVQGHLLLLDAREIRLLLHLLLLEEGLLGHLVVELALVGVAHLLLEHLALLDLLLRHQLAPLRVLLVLLLQPVLLFLLAHREVLQVLLIDVVLLVQRCLLRG